jgi:hypothetical protein
MEPHVVWVRYLGSKRFVPAYRGRLDHAETEIRRIKKTDRTIADMYLLPEGHDVEIFHQRRLAEDRRNGFLP